MSFRWRLKLFSRAFWANPNNFQNEFTILITYKYHKRQIMPQLFVLFYFFIVSKTPRTEKFRALFNYALW